MKNLYWFLTIFSIIIAAPALYTMENHISPLLHLALKARCNHIDECVEQGIAQNEQASTIIETIWQTHKSLPQDLEEKIITTLANRWAAKVYSSYHCITTYYDGRILNPEQKLNPSLGTNFSPWHQLSLKTLIKSYITVHQAKKGGNTHPQTITAVPTTTTTATEGSRAVSPQFNGPELSDFELI